MICTLTARRLKPDSYEQFRAAWDPTTVGSDVLRHWRTIYHCRDVSDPDVVISFGLFDGSLEDLRTEQSRLGRTDRVDRVGPHVDEVLLDGSYEVIEVLTAAS